jgi:hypothetical protein
MTESKADKKAADSKSAFWSSDKVVKTESKGQ